MLLYLLIQLFEGISEDSCEETKYQKLKKKTFIKNIFLRSLIKEKKNQKIKI